MDQFLECDRCGDDCYRVRGAWLIFDRSKRIQAEKDGELLNPPRYLNFCYRCGDIKMETNPELEIDGYRTARKMRISELESSHAIFGEILEATDVEPKRIRLTEYDTEGHFPEGKLGTISFDHSFNSVLDQIYSFLSQKHCTVITYTND